MTVLSEDEMFKRSTQYRYWFCGSGTLERLRAATNQAAAQGVMQAVPGLARADCLNVDEEQRLVNFYIVKAMQLADFCDFPTNVKATAVQFMRRFYLLNSPMTYHPKELMPCAIFLATKTENHYISLNNFVSNLPKTTAEQVIAPEFLLTQSLRFAFDVRHPFRALEGCYMDLLTNASGERGKAVFHTMAAEITPPASFNSNTPPSSRDLTNWINEAYSRGRETLKTAALLTDVYFTHSPSHIALAALALGDASIGRWYLSYKLNSRATSTPSQNQSPELRQRIEESIRQCSAALKSAPLTSAENLTDKAELDELKRIDKKLYRCRNPGKVDLVGLNRASKGDGEDGTQGQGDGAAEGEEPSKTKKRRLEREKAEREAESVFGGSL